jgi:hypothetical protein
MTAFGGAMGCALGAWGALAQSGSNDQLSSGGLKHTFSIADVSAILEESSISAAAQPYEGDDSATLMATTAGDGRFLISLFQCERPEDGEGCSGATIFTGFPNAGVTFDELNHFNSESNVTRAVNVAEQNLVLFGMQIFFNGGIGRENFKYVVELFLSDMQNHVDGKMAGGMSVSLDKAPPSRKKIDNLTKSGDREAQKGAFGPGYNLDQALNAAVSNSWDVNFSLTTD